MRGYVMAGLPSVFGTRAGLVLHTSFERFTGADPHPHRLPFGTPLPNRWRSSTYGPVVDSDPPVSTMFNFDGKLLRAS
jgi:hypothetical protein